MRSKSYGQTFIINKLECVGQVQKRLGCHLRTLRQTYRGKTLSDSKGISDKVRLTDKSHKFASKLFWNGNKTEQ